MDKIWIMGLCDGDEYVIWCWVFCLWCSDDVVDAVLFIYNGTAFSLLIGFLYWRAERINICLDEICSLLATWTYKYMIQIILLALSVLSI